MTGRLGLIILLIVLGAGWGLSQPLSKIVVAGGHDPLGLMFWHLVVGTGMMAALSLARGRGLPLGRAQLWRYLVIALIGAILPGVASYQAAIYLPAGVISLFLSLIPMFSFPMALAMGNDRFGWAQMLGLLCGMAGVLLIALPEASLPDPAMLVFLPVALIAPAFYALEGNVVARWGRADLDPVQLLWGVGVVGMLISGPLAWMTGRWVSPLDPWGAPQSALAVSAVINASAYAGYVWMVGQAGAVFAAQVAYLVTGFGVIWAMLLLGESYSGWVWAAMGAMMLGLMLVTPRGKAALVPDETGANDYI